jgi:hypothetical protein
MANLLHYMCHENAAIAQRKSSRFDMTGELRHSSCGMKRWSRILTALQVAVFSIGSLWLGAVHNHESGSDHHECVACVWHSMGAEETQPPIVAAIAHAPSAKVIAPDFVAPVSDAQLYAPERAPPADL